MKKILRSPVGWAACLATVLSLSCGPSRTTVAPAAAKRYPLSGRVVAIDKTNKSIDIDGKEIPGFMPAMTMPYSAKDESMLDKLGPGDQIIAEIVVSERGTYLESVTITAKAVPPTPQK
jgi:Cu/Ag efflux protein CusF